MKYERKKGTALLVILLGIGLISGAPTPASAQSTHTLANATSGDEPLYPIVVSETFIATTNEALADAAQTTVHHEFVGDLKIVYAQPKKKLSATQPAFSILTCPKEYLEQAQMDDMRQRFIHGSAENLMALIKDPKKSPFVFESFKFNGSPAILLFSPHNITYAPYAASFLLMPNSLTRSVSNTFHAEKVALLKNEFFVVVLFGQLLITPSNQKGYTALASWIERAKNTERNHLVSEKIYILTENDVTMYH